MLLIDHHNKLLIMRTKYYRPHCLDKRTRNEEPGAEEMGQMGGHLPGNPDGPLNPTKCDSRVQS